MQDTVKATRSGSNVFIAEMYFLKSKCGAVELTGGHFEPTQSWSLPLKDGIALTYLLGIVLSCIIVNYHTVSSPHYVPTMPSIYIFLVPISLTNPDL